MHLTEAGFPPHVAVSRIGQIRGIEEWHRIGKIPPYRTPSDYGRFGTLSAHGQAAALRQYARHAGDMGQGVTSGGNILPVT